MLIISHRGAKGSAPENTKASFEAGLKSNAGMIEFDIRTSKDGTLVICHDPIMNGYKIVNTAYAELKKSDPELLTFTEVLKIVDNKRPLLIEIKKGADIPTVMTELQRHSFPKGSIIGSFNLAILKAAKKTFPDTELLVIHKWSGVIATHRARILGTKRIAMNYRWLWSGFIRAVVRSGYKLTPYTMNNPAKVKKWEKLGLYGCVTDYPERF
jgi:glycerophosphoryl diester phosphodiesterase